MHDEPLDMLVIRDMPDGTFDLHLVQDGFATRTEVKKFIEDYYLARGIIARPAPKKH